MSDDDKKNPDDVAEIVEDVIVEEVEVEPEVENFDDLAPPIAKNGSFGALIVAALLGGVATVTLIAGLGYYAVTSNNLGGLSNLLNGGDAAQAAEERYTDVSTRILSLEGELAAMLGEEPVAVDLSPIADKIAALSAALSLQDEQGVILAEKVKGIEDSIAHVAQKDDGGFDNRIIIALQSELNALKKTVASAPTSTVSSGVDDAVLNAAIAQIDKKIAALETELTAVKAVAEKAGSATSSADNSGMVAALALASLERALQDEKPFETELNAIKSIVGDNEKLTELSAYAASGLPSETTLLGQFDGLLEAALIADLKGDGASILEKFIGNAKSIISIRQTGNMDGDSIEAVLARMEVAIVAKDLSAALEQSHGLNGAAEEVFATWIGSATNRIAAQDLMRQVSADILTSLQ